MDTHPHTKQWLHCHFGLDTVPTWWKRREELIPELADLWNIRQAIFYENGDAAEFQDKQRAISRKFILKYSIIHHLIGVMATDPSDPFGCLRDYLRMGTPRLIRTQHTNY